MIYFDNSATTYPKPECVYKALDFANRNLAFNAGRGSYKEAKDTANMIYDVRRKLASFVNADPDNVIFTSSATEALNLIINGINYSNNDAVYISPFEHNAVVRPLYNIQKETNIDIRMLPFDKETWQPIEKEIEDQFSIRRPKAVIISQLSNVTGLELDYKTIFRIAKKYGAITVLDSAQSFGVLNPDLANCDFCVFAGHKSLYASFGVAGFIDSGRIPLKILKAGGNGSDSLNHNMPEKGYERYEAGSLNSVAIYALGVSCDWLKEQDVKSHEEELTTYLIESLSKIDKVKLYLPKGWAIFGTLSINIEDYLADDVASILAEEYNILVRSGYHCSPFVHEFIGSGKHRGTVRISLGAFNTKEEINVLSEALETF